jgi:hypothetical protein
VSWHRGLLSLLFWIILTLRLCACRVVWHQGALLDRTGVVTSLVAVLLLSLVCSHSVCVCSVPLARSSLGAPAVIYAMELNPDSASYLLQTVVANKVRHVVSVIQGYDCSPAFLPSLLRLVRMMSSCLSILSLPSFPVRVEWNDFVFFFSFFLS